jgi:SulP family sulfate permease
VVVWPKSYTMPVGVRLGWHHRLRRVAAHLPGTVVALVGATLLARGLHLPVETIGSRFGGIPRVCRASPCRPCPGTAPSSCSFPR